jgi:tRNA(Ile2) C34 agmatinyltransferase TiaS
MGPAGTRSELELLRFYVAPGGRQTSDVYRERPPICPACGVTMVPADLSARTPRDPDWICLECEETDELDLERGAAPGGVDSH